MDIIISFQSLIENINFNGVSYINKWIWLVQLTKEDIMWIVEDGIICFNNLYTFSKSLLLWKKLFQLKGKDEFILSYILSKYESELMHQIKRWLN